jgi:hypothetical protein
MDWQDTPLQIFPLWDRSPAVDKKLSLSPYITVIFSLFNLVFTYIYLSPLFFPSSQVIKYFETAKKI